MKKSWLSILLLAFSVAHADEINYEKQCPGGGTRVVTGDYDSDSGDFTLNTEVLNCVKRHHTVSNGSITSSGSFVPGDNGLAVLSATVNSHITRERKGHTSTFVCEKTVSGNYDLETSIVDGTVSSSCERTGAIFAPILRLLSEENDDDEEQEQAEDEQS